MRIKDLKRDVEISYNELMNELDKYRPNKTYWADKTLTKEQKNFIKQCREHPAPIGIEPMCELWEKLGWGKIGRNAMTTLAKKVKTNNYK